MKSSARLAGGLWALAVPLILLSATVSTDAISTNVRGAAGRPSEAFTDLVTTNIPIAANVHGSEEFDASSAYISRQQDNAAVLESEEESRKERDEGEGQDGGSPEGDQSDLVSSTPLGTAKGRAGVLTILLTIVLTSAALFQAYKHRTEVLTFFSSIRHRASHASLSSLSLPGVNFRSVRSGGIHLPFKMPTLVLPSSLSIASKRRARRPRRSKPKGGFRPHASRLNAWASEDGLFDDIRDDRSSSSSNDADIEAGLEGGDTLDLGVNEDFMIGASRSYPPTTLANKAAMGAQRQSQKSAHWWTKPSKKAKVASGVRNVLFSLDDGEEVETDEGLPLAPTPHNYGLGGVRVYGSANTGVYGH